MRKYILIGIFTLALVLAILSLYLTYSSSQSREVALPIINNISSPKKIVNPFGKLIENNKPEIVIPDTKFYDKQIFNVLLIGIDRRNKSQLGFNTDTMILVTVDTVSNKVLLTSVPRDLWINGNKINALYTISGPDTLTNAFEQISGQKVDGYIVCDFSDFKWIIDSMGGVPVNVERTFTDYTFPNDSDTDIMTVNFIQGSEVMSGSRALTFARSRKGDNGEGSDLMRAKRQHLILKGMLDAIKQPSSVFWPMDISNFYNTVTAVDKMFTTLTLNDAIYLWDFYKDKDKYSIESFVLDEAYIYHPGLYPNSEYHAWVYIPKDPAWSQLHSDVLTKLQSSPSATQ